MMITMPLGLWREAVGWATAAVVKTPASKGKNDMQQGLHFYFADEPMHFDKDWHPISPRPGVTLLSTDRYRLTWASLPASDLVIVDTPLPTPAVLHLYLPAVLHAMKAWPKAGSAEDYAWTVDLHYDDVATLTLRDGPHEFSVARIPLHTGTQPTFTPAWFAKQAGPSKKAAPFALDPSLLLPLIQAASKLWRHEALRMRSWDQRHILLSRKPMNDAPLLASGLQMGVDLAAAR
jgi:hypothetical protein